jgi:hypothetical protein
VTAMENYDVGGAIATLTKLQNKVVLAQGALVDARAQAAATLAYVKATYGAGPDEPSVEQP